MEEEKEAQTNLSRQRAGPRSSAGALRQRVGLTSSYKLNYSLPPPPERQRQAQGDRDIPRALSVRG